MTQDQVQTEATGETGSEDVIGRVTEAISQGIRSGVFVPGQHLVEPTLTKRLGISRGSLREAFKHLAAAGIITLTRYRGACIGIMDRKSIHDLLDTLQPLAELAAELAAKHCDSADKQRQIREAADAIAQAGRRGSRAQYMESRRHFYDVMVELGGNRELARVMPLSRTDIFRAQIEAVQMEEHRLRHSKGYSKVAEAIASQNPAAARRAIHRHFDGTRKTLDQIPERYFPEAGI